MTFRPQDVQKALVKKGFVAQDSHHRQYWFHVDGKRTSINTKMSHNKQEIGAPLIACMSRQMRLTKNEFTLFVQCTLTEEAYRKKVISENQVQLS